MREIKFRVWSNLDKKMFIAGELELAEDDNGEDYYSVSYYNPDKKYWEHLIGRENIELMQYTGLKDKNGVEIFEGDVVKCYNKHLNYDFSSDKNIPGYGFAVIKNSGWSFYYDKIKADNKWFFYYPEGDNFYPDNIDMIIEVIGNIYENPELLEEK